jgi:hypothetical protein
MPKNTVMELPLVRRPLALINLVNAGLPVAGMTFDTVRSQLGRVVRPGICRNSFFPSAGLWPALTEEGEAECSRAGNLIGQ